MHWAVNLDHEPCIVTVEIRDEKSLAAMVFEPQRELPLEFLPAHSPVPDRIP